ncbi:MAG: hypothetical protein QOH57_564, partial [Mycobacterium sp.]|nr:hypothetical protein [Mycobacterium sp.]
RLSLPRFPYLGLPAARPPVASDSRRVAGSLRRRTSRGRGHDVSFGQRGQLGGRLVSPHEGGAAYRELRVHVVGEVRAKQLCQERSGDDEIGELGTDVVRGCPLLAWPRWRRSCCTASPASSATRSPAISVLLAPLRRSCASAMAAMRGSKKPMVATPDRRSQAAGSSTLKTTLRVRYRTSAFGAERRIVVGWQIAVVHNWGRAS